MSKSKPDTAIFMTDTREDIERKIAKAWCPEGITHENPVLEYFKYIIFETQDTVTINRPEQFGGSITFETYETLEKAFASKVVHPVDLKQTLIEPLDKLLQPVRDHFEKDVEAKALLEKVQSFSVTR
jgi:tyrosyl-tRNA synthetase